MTAKELTLSLLEAATFRRVLIALAVLAFLPELLGVAAWSVPVLLGLASSNSAESLAGSLLGVLANAGIVYALIRGGRALLERFSRGAPS